MLIEYITEIIVGGVLTVFAVLFRSWSQSATRQAEKILEKLEQISATFHAHELTDAAMLAQINADVMNIYKRIDRDSRMQDRNSGNNGH